MSICDLAGLYKGFQHLNFLIDSPPQVVNLAIDLYENFVHMPLPILILLAPEPGNFVTYINPKSMENILDIAKNLSVRCS